MGLAEGIQAGLQLRDYVENNAQKQEQSRLQAQLFKSQADHLDAQNQLLHMELQNQAQFQQATAPLRQAFTQRQMQQYQPQATAPAPAQDSLTAPWVTPPMAPPTTDQTRLPTTYGGTSRDPMSMDEDLMVQLAHQKTLWGIKGGPEMLSAAINLYKERQAAKQNQHLDYVGKLQGQYIMEAQAAEANGGKLAPLTEQWYRGAIAQSLDAAGKPDEARQFLAGKWQTIQPGAIGGVVSPTQNFTPQVVNPNQPPVPITAGGGLGQRNPMGPIMLGPNGELPAQAPPQASPPGPARAPVQVLPGQTTTVPEPNASEIAQMTQQLIGAGMPPEEAQRTAPIVLKAMSPVPAPAPGSVSRAGAPPPQAAPGSTTPGVTILKEPAPLGAVAEANAAGSTTGTAQANRALPLAQQPGEHGRGWIDTQTGKPVKASTPLGTVLDAVEQTPAGQVVPYKQLSNDDQKEFGQLTRHLPAYNKLGELLEQLYGPQGLYGQYQNRVTAGFKGTFAKFMQDDPALVRYTRELAPLATSFKAYAGETGRLTDQDRAVLSSVYPNVGALPDRPDVAQGLMQDIADIVSGQAGAILNNPNFKLQGIKVPKLGKGQASTGQSQGPSSDVQQKIDKMTPEQRLQRLHELEQKAKGGR